MTETYKPTKEEVEKLIAEAKADLMSLTYEEAEQILIDVKAEGLARDRR